MDAYVRAFFQGCACASLMWAQACGSRVKPCIAVKREGRP
ncbi:hypothetical protein LDBPK_211810 [Leishmania donovani]|uniref:Uncharacterized protein n=1 Tax=Leishmania donovani TaxID=5661 RepID=E9BFG7_LEIDO|nr:hypothetical protein LDBPK_211810 [Leishmania donovani]AYU78646.1 hypothetical protein LdCL_210023850 [Leishmania donovani]CBZ33993.1 hypothetical protein LDBPK_211810 [Leishmania donovani]